MDKFTSKKSSEDKQNHIVNHLKVGGLPLCDVDAVGNSTIYPTKVDCPKCKQKMAGNLLNFIPH